MPNLYRCGGCPISPIGQSCFIVLSVVVYSFHFHLLLDSAVLLASILIRYLIKIGMSIGFYKKAEIIFVCLNFANFAVFSPPNAAFGRPVIRIIPLCRPGGLVISIPYQMLLDIYAFALRLALF